MDEYLCLTLVSRDSESDQQFQKRLIEFWSTMIRAHPFEYQRVYAELAKSEFTGEHWARKYLVAFDVIELLELELAAAQIDYLPVDRDDVFSKYEATPPEWFL